MTAHAMRGDKERCLASGMDGYISKPIQPSGLFAEIERCVATAKGSKAMTDNHQELDEQIDRASLLERVEGDRELLTEMIHLFQEDVPNLVTAMRNALESGDMAVLERSAHSLKGAVSNLSAKATAAAAMQLEKDAKNKDTESAKESLAKVEGAVNKLMPALAELCQGVTK
jgi:HPt (histidine-containing phosphotransfer) domain-containing protein